MSSIRTAVNTAEIPLSLRGRTVLKGPGDKQEWLYLSPRMAYWLSSCKCCIGAPLVSSLPRFLCFTTSKVFSISRSLKTQIQAKFQQLHCGLPSSINSLARLHVFSGGWQRRELCITEDLWRCLVVNSFGRGQPSPWGAIHARSFRLWHFNFLWNDNKNISSTPTWETYLSVSPVVSEKLTDSVVLRLISLTHRCGRRGRCPRLAPRAENFVSADQYNFSIFTDFFLFIFFFLFVFTGSTSQTMSN